MELSWHPFVIGCSQLGRIFHIEVAAIEGNRIVESRERIGIPGAEVAYLVYASGLETEFDDQHIFLMRDNEWCLVEQRKGTAGPRRGPSEFDPIPMGDILLTVGDKQRALAILD